MGIFGPGREVQLDARLGKGYCEMVGGMLLASAACLLMLRVRDVARIYIINSQDCSYKYSKVYVANDVVLYECILRRLKNCH